MSLDEQYRTDANLRARIELHARFSTAKDWAQWLFDREAAPPGARILDVGCGPATLWEANRDRIDPSWRLTLVDRSPGMIEAAQTVLGERAEYVVADAQALPFPDESFDVAIANHMLYHVPERPKALAELARVLVAGGVLHASTNGRGHMRRLHELVEDWDFAQHTEEFGLETGVAQLEQFFEDVRVERHECHLEVTEIEPVVAYVRSSSRFHGSDEQVRRVAEAEITRGGVFRIEKSQGVLHARKA